MGEEVIPPGEARVFRLEPGSRLAVRDLEGHQACELLAFVADDPGEYLDCAVTMEIVGRLYPTERSKFYSNLYEPILTLMEDQVGCHDLLHPSSSARSRMLFLGDTEGRVGTRERSLAALTAAGIEGIHVPRPVHLFRRTVVDPEGNFAMMETPSGPGSKVVLQCERAVVVVLAVPDDEISPVCGCNPSPIGVEITPPR